MIYIYFFSHTHDTFVCVHACNLNNNNVINRDDFFYLHGSFFSMKR